VKNESESEDDRPINNYNKSQHELSSNNSTVKTEEVEEEKEGKRTLYI